MYSLLILLWLMVTICAYMESKNKDYKCEKVVVWVSYAIVILMLFVAVIDAVGA